MSSDTWFTIGVTIAVICLSLLIFATVYLFIICKNLMCALEGAVVLILESGWVEGFDPKNRTVQLSEKKMSSRGFVAANLVISSAAVLHGRWLEKKLKERIVKHAVDGIYTRYVC